MLHVFRKYEKFIYIVITIVVILSFSFFGTYSTLQTDPVVDNVVFTAVDGSEIRRSELEQLIQFIGTSNEDKLLFGGAWGPNFLNDGVVKKDILQPGLAEVLVANYTEDLKKDLDSRLAKEKRYQPYVHPQAEFVSVVNVWDYLAPDLKKSFDTLRRSKDPIDNEAIQARVRLFLEERNLPSPTLRQVLKYQEKQYGFVSHDPNLDYTDLSMFGYHTLDDWFGPNFMRLVGEFIINSAILAQEKGYVVSKDEALADLNRNAEVSFQQNIRNPNLGVASSKEYFKQQLQRMGIDQNQAIKIWQKVLLFRRLFQDPSNAIVVSPFLFKNFTEYAKEKVEGELYQLPVEMRFGDFITLQEFETYLKAVSDRSGTGQALLAFPQKFKNLDEVAKNYPELVQRKYVLNVARVDKDRLQARVGVKQTWDWEVQDENWEKLRKKYPEIGTKKADKKEQRFVLLDKLDSNTRLRVDTFARMQIVEEHPEWVDQALEKAEAEKMEIGIPRKGQIPLVGFEDSEMLIKLLDRYPDSSKELSRVTGDQNNYYKITVLERSDKEEILTFKEALAQEVLAPLVNKELESYFQSVKSAQPELKNKPFKEVKQKVAELYFADVLKAINDDYQANAPKDKAYKQLIPDIASSLRFFKYMREARKALMQDPKSEKWVGEHNETLESQWKLTDASHEISRSSGQSSFNIDELFTLKSGDWTNVATPANGDMQFVAIKGKGKEFDLADVNDQLWGAHQLIAQEAQRVIMQSVMDTIQSKDAINLDFTKP